MVEKFYRFSCKDCPTVSEYPDKDAAQSRGWAIARGGKNCYCPRCALNHRNTGKCGAKPTQATQVQMRISGVQDSA